MWPQGVTQTLVNLRNGLRRKAMLIHAHCLLVRNVMVCSFKDGISWNLQLTNAYRLVEWFMHLPYDSVVSLTDVNSVRKLQHFIINSHQKSAGTYWFNGYQRSLGPWPCIGTGTYICNLHRLTNTVSLPFLVKYVFYWTHRTVSQVISATAHDVHPVLGSYIEHLR